MKILHILNDITYSGAEKMLYDAARWYTKFGFKVYILSIVRTGGDNFEGELEKLGYDVHHIRYSKSLSFFEELRRFIRQNGFDIVHIHPEGAFFWIATICKLAGSKKLCRTIHSNFDFKGYLLFRRRLQRRLARSFFKVKYIAISASVYDNELRRFNNRTELINNYVDTNRFDRSNYTEYQNQELKQSLSIDSSDVVITSVGACTRLKNHKVIINLVKRLRIENIDVVYIHLGKGQLEANEKEYAEELGISKYVRFIGNTLNIADYLAITDIYLMPSLNEGVGNACIEALSMSCLAAVNDTPGLNALIKDKDNGLLVRHNDIEEYTRIIREYKNDPKSFQNICLKARVIVCQEYSIEKSMRSYFDFYNKL